MKAIEKKKKNDNYQISFLHASFKEKDFQKISLHLCFKPPTFQKTFQIVNQFWDFFGSKNFCEA